MRVASLRCLQCGMPADLWGHICSRHETVNFLLSNCSERLPLLSIYICLAFPVHHLVVFGVRESLSLLSHPLQYPLRVYEFAESNVMSLRRVSFGCQIPVGRLHGIHVAWMFESVFLKTSVEQFVQLLPRPLRLFECLGSRPV